MGWKEIRTMRPVSQMLWLLTGEKIWFSSENTLKAGFHTTPHTRSHETVGFYSALSRLCKTLELTSEQEMLWGPISRGNWYPSSNINTFQCSLHWTSIQPNVKNVHMRGPFRKVRYLAYRHAPTGKVSGVYWIDEWEWTLPNQLLQHGGIAPVRNCVGID